MKKHIPNILTSLNTLSGCIACVMAFERNFLWVVIWIAAAAIFDFFDGFAARMLRVQSPIGKDLDSLADMISFGIAPAITLYSYLSLQNACTGSGSLIPYISFLLVIFSALRLAKFNIDQRQTSSFIGLPTPANALFWISICYGLSLKDEAFQILSFYPILILVVIFSLLMTSEIPMFSLKINNFRFKGNELRYILIVVIIISTCIWGILGVAVGICFYVLLSIITGKLKK